MKKIDFYVIALILVSANILYAQFGSLDVTFDIDGKLTTPIGTSNEGINAVALQADGKMVVAGSSNNGSDNDFAVARYNTNGSLDNSFSSDGKVTTAIGTGNDFARSISVQSDGKIVVSGWSSTGTTNDFAVARYNTDGSLDDSFSSDGKLTTSIGDDRGFALAIQPDGKILVAGYSNTGSKDEFVVVRYNTNGSLDNTFNSTGMKTISIGSNNDRAFSISLQADEKIVLAGHSNNNIGSDFALVRCNSDGTLDNSFGTGGKLTTSIGIGIDIANSVVIQSDGKIIAAGYSYVGTKVLFALVRYNANGTLDNTFSIDGIVTTTIGSNNDFANSIIIQPDGKIVVIGYSEKSTNSAVFALVRYSSNGILDFTFGSNGIVTTEFGSGRDEASSALFQQDGKIVVAGRSNNGMDYDFALARYDDLGLVGTNNVFISKEMLKVYPNPISDSATLEYILKEDKNISICLMDIQGKVVQTFLENQHQASGIQRLNLTFSERMIAGEYFVVISSAQGQVSIKVVK